MSWMRRTNWGLAGIVTIALMVGAADGHAQQRSGPRPDRGGAGVTTTPLDRLLEARAALGLTEGQVTAISAIRDTLLTDTESMRSRLASMRQKGSGAGEDARTVMQQLRERDAAAARSALALLDDRQRREALLLLERRRPRGSGGSAAVGATPPLPSRDQAPAEVAPAGGSRAF